MSWPLKKSRPGVAVGTEMIAGREEDEGGIHLGQQHAAVNHATAFSKH